MRFNLILLFLLISNVCASRISNTVTKNRAKIDLIFDNIDDGVKFYLYNEKSIIIKSAVSANNKVYFNIAFDQKNPIGVIIRAPKKEYILLLYLDSYHTEVKISKNQTSISGSTIMNEIQNYKDETEELERQRNSVITTTGYEKADSIQRVITAISMKYIDKPDSFFGLMMLRQELKLKHIDIETGKSKFSRYSADFKNSEIGKGTADLLATYKKLKPGDDAPSFTLQMDNDLKVSLSDFKGKYVLLHFWATWCGPCMQELPGLLKIYNDNLKKGNLEIIGISFDQNRKTFLKTIEKHNINWINYHDPKGWYGYLANLFGVDALPTNILISPDQKIINLKIYTEQLNSILPQ